MQNFVFVLDGHQRPLDPCHPAVARKLLRAGKAAVFRRWPFTLILKREVNAPTQPLELKIDPGAKTTGMVLVQAGKVIWAAEIEHRGSRIKKALDARRARRRRRRGRLRYRAPRFANRRRPAGWLPPSLRHRVATLLTWVRRLCQWVPVTGLAQELVKFDMQALHAPELSSVEYQQGTLAGFELREYLLAKWGRTCAYCGQQAVPLQVEHIQPRSLGGSNRVSNLALACRACNQRKGNQDVRVFLASEPQRLHRVLAQAQAPLQAAAAVNATRWALYESLKATGLPVRTGTGALTHFNRRRLGLPKAHWIDAACVGRVETLTLLAQQPLRILCKGQGSRQKAVLNRYGYPLQHRPLRPVLGWRHGDLAKFEGKTYIISPRHTGSFELRAPPQKPFSRSVRRLTRVHRFDGYAYAFGEKS